MEMEKEIEIELKNERKSRGGILSFISFLLIIILWCVLTYGGFVSKIFVPSPTDVINAVISMVKDGSLWEHCFMSAKRVMVGWFWSAVIALPLGMLMAGSKRFSALIQPLIEFARYLPVVALVPLTILYLGIDETQKYVIIWLGTFFQLILMVCDTVSSVDKNMINAARTLGAGRFQVYREVILPASLPGLLDDFRLTIGWAWTYLVVAEMVAASSGLGYIILKSQRFLATDVIFAGLIMIGLIGLVTDLLMRIITRLVVPWYERLGD
ncbi:MAG: ABC transporter permease [Lachnospiraceae bacterium]|nr:ABC transporter permease [Lachnospiraceae bacterium]